MKHNISLFYSNLFDEEKAHPIWEANKEGIELVVTVIARNVSKDHILHSIKELDEILNNQQDKNY